MADRWLPDVERIPGNDAGPMAGGAARRILLHSTEGSTIEGAVSAYRQHNSWPTLTVDAHRRRIAQHLPLDRAARALRNTADGVETNRAGAVLVQIELVGFANRPASIGDPDDLAWIGERVIAPVARAMGVPLTSTVRWAPYPASYGMGLGQRLAPAAWAGYSGLLGHQHAPENSHGDPGAIDIDTILTAARAALDEEDDMDIADLRRELTTGGTPTRNAVYELARKAQDDAFTESGTKVRSGIRDVLEVSLRDDQEIRGTLTGLMEAAAERALRKVLAERDEP